MNRLLLFSFCLSCLMPCCILSQKYDFKWLMGYSFADNPLDTGWGCSIMDFDTPDGNPIFYEEKYKKIDFYNSSANICDESGNYLFSCNGGYVEGPNDQLMENADNIQFDIYYPQLGTPNGQAVLIIPYPSKPKQYILFNKTDDFFTNLGTTSNELLYSVIDMSYNNNNGKMILRKISLVKDTLDSASLICVKHANGRDWWVVVSEDTEIGYYIFLVSDKGIKLQRKQVFPGIKHHGEFGQSFFSNDGKYLATATDDHINQFYYIYFFSFDRCEGILANYQLIKLPFQDDWGPGCSFSPDNRYFYFATVDSLYQYTIDQNKLVNRNLIDSYDGYKEPTKPTFLVWTEFGIMQQAPDGRIYNTAAGRSMHVINSPNEAGKLCGFKQHEISCPTVKQCLPNFPNYRLGPIDGSICDSLGIDNIPWCNWRYSQDTSDHLLFDFTNLSAYEVTAWCWDFGDPNSTSNTSMDKNPMHIFSKNGIYTVCLIAKNNNGADTLCRTIKIGTTVVTNNQNNNVKINTFPNPCKDYLIINVLDYNPEKMILRLYNQLGENVLMQKLYQGSNNLDIKQLTSGVYFISIFEKGILFKTENLQKY